MTQKLIAIPLFCSYPSHNFEDSGPPILGVKTENAVCVGFALKPRAYM